MNVFFELLHTAEGPGLMCTCIPTYMAQAYTVYDHFDQAALRETVLP